MTRMIAYVKVCMLFLAPALSGYGQGGKLLFPQQPGVVSFTYRQYFQKDMATTLDIVKANGITDIEFFQSFLSKIWPRSYGSSFWMKKGLQLFIFWSEL